MFKMKTWNLLLLGLVVWTARCQVDNDPAAAGEGEGPGVFDYQVYDDRSFFAGRHHSRHKKLQMVFDKQLKRPENITELPSDVSTLEADTYYTLKIESLNFTNPSPLEEDEFYTITMGGGGFMNVRVYQGGPDTMVIEHMLKVEYESESLVPFDRDLFGLRPGDMIEFARVEGMPTGFFFIIQKRKKLELAFGEEVKLSGAFVSQLSLRIVNRQTQRAREGSRLKFLVETSPDDFLLDSNEHIEMYVSKGDRRPTRSSHDFRAAGSMGTGLVKMIMPRSPFYCIDPGCVYSVTFYLRNVADLYVIPDIVDQRETAASSNAFYIEEELAVGESIDYVIPASRTSPLWKFEFFPLRGEVDYEIFPVKNATQRIAGRTDGLEKVLAARTNLKEFKVVFTNTEDRPIAFKFESTRALVDLPTFLARDVRYVGAVDADEVKKFMLDLKAQKTTVVSVKIEFKLLQGKAELFLGECLKSECKVPKTEEDFKNKSQITARSAAFDKESKTDFLDLSFNCVGAGEVPNNGLPSSESCMFAIAVRPNATQLSLFSIRMTGQLKADSLNWKGSYHTTIYAKNHQALSLRLDTLDPADEEVVLRFTLLAGNIIAFLSFDHPFPDSNNKLKSVSLQTSDSVLPTVDEEVVVLPLPADRRNVLAINIYAEKYSVVEICPSSGRKGHNMLFSEAISIDQIIARALNAADFKQSSLFTGRVKNFALEVPRGLADNLLITVNSESSLQICVLLQRDFSPESKCDLSTKGQSLRVPAELLRLKSATNIVISVQSRRQGEEGRSDEEHFNLRVVFDKGVAHSKLSVPGQVNSFTLGPQSDFRLEIDLTQMTRSAFIGFDSDDALLDLAVLADTYVLGGLKKDVFGFHVTDADHFKRSYCGKDCSIFLVTKTWSEGTMFSVTFTLDDWPVQLSEGKTAILSAINPTYVTLATAGVVGELRVKAHSDGTLVSLYSVPLSEKIKKETRLEFVLSKKVFKSSTSASLSPVLHFDAAEVARTAHFLLLVSPAATRPEVEQSGGFLLEMNGDAAIKLEAFSAVRKLTPGSPLRGEVRANAFDFFSIRLSSPRRFSLVLSLSGGEANLYLNPGYRNFTRLDFFGLASLSHRGDEAIVTTDAFYNELDFTVGVYGVKSTKYSLLMVGNATVIDVVPQVYNEIMLEEGRPVFLDPFQAVTENWGSLVYADRGAVQLSTAAFSDLREVPRLTSGQSDQNFTNLRLVEPVSEPLTDFLDHSSKNSILRLQTSQKRATATLLVCNKKLPVEALIDRRFTFALSAGEKVTFLASFGYSTNTVDFDLRALRGQVTVQLCETQTCVGQTHSVSAPDALQLEFSAMKQQDKSKIMKEFFITVEAASDALFSGYVRPREGFVELREFSAEVVQAHPTREQFFFYYVPKHGREFVNSLRFKVFCADPKLEAPTVLFSASPAGNFEDPSAFQKTEFLEVGERSVDGAKEYEFVPKVQNGYFFVKIAPDAQKSWVKVVLTVNDDFSFDTSGLMIAQLPPTRDSTKFLGAFVPEAGTMKLRVHTCGDFILQKAVLVDPLQNSSKEKLFNVGRDQMNFLNFGPKETRSQFSTLEHYVFDFDGPGVLKLNYTTRSVLADRIGRLQKSVVLQTEFKPREKDRFLSDYILAPTLGLTDPKLIEFFASSPDDANYFMSTKDRRTFFYSFNFGRTLKVSVTLPGIDFAIINDYPELHKAVATVNFLINSTPALESALKSCGLALAITSSDTVERVTQVIALHNLSSPPTELSVAVEFNEEKLKKFSTRDEFSLFVYVSFAFTHSDLPNPTVFKDARYVLVPLFLKQFQIRKGAIVSLEAAAAQWKLLSVVAVVGLALVCFILRRARKQPAAPYTRPADHSSIIEITVKD